MCILWPLDRCIGQHINRHSTDISVIISTDTPTMNWSTYWTDNQPICQSTYQPTQYVGWRIDRCINWDIGQVKLTFQPTISRYLGRYIGRHLADMLTIDWAIPEISIPIPRTAFRISEGKGGGSRLWNSEGMGKYLRLEIRRHGGIIFTVGIYGVESVEWVPWKCYHCGLL